MRINITLFSIVDFQMNCSCKKGPKIVLGGISRIATYFILKFILWFSIVLHPNS